MKRNATLFGAVLIVLLFVRVRPAKADLFGIPGLPTIVFDPTTAADVLKDVAGVLQLIRISHQAYQAYQNAQQFFSGGWKYQWRGIVTQIGQQYASNVYGETINWNAAISLGTGSPGAWQNAGMIFTPNPTTIIDRRQWADLASVEITDAAGINAVQTVGQSTADRMQVDSSLASYEQIVLDGTAGTNSEVQQLNLITAGTTLGLHYQQLQDNKVSALLQLQAAQAKQSRDALAGQIQFQNDVQTYAQTEGFGLGTCVSCSVLPVVQ